MELSGAELKLLFGGHDDIFTEVQDRMSLTATQVTGRFVVVVLMTRFFTFCFLECLVHAGLVAGR